MIVSTTLAASFLILAVLVSSFLVESLSLASQLLYFFAGSFYLLTRFGSAQTGDAGL
jgi:hypothetical protein